METDVGVLPDVGSRLRSERERLRLNQEDFGSLAGVTRNSQQTYEAGKRPFSVSYLLALKEHQVDIVYVLVGERSAGGLSEEQARIVSAFDTLEPVNRQALLQLACSLAGHPVPSLARTIRTLKSSVLPPVILKPIAEICAFGVRRCWAVAQTRCPE